MQYFENSASRGIYRDGWYACAFGPFVPWDTASTAQRMAAWNAETEPWELYYLPEDFSQANDLAAAQPEKLDRAQGAVQGGVAGQPGLAGRRRAVAAHASRGPHLLAVHPVAVRQPHAPGCRSSPRRVWVARTAASRSH